MATDTRRLATRAEIGEDNWRLVQKLAGVDRDIPDNEKKLPLLVTGRNENTGEQTVEVVHEALIREWGKLREWIEDDRAFLTWRDQLRVSIAQWNRDKDEGTLLRGKPLDISEDWLQKRAEYLTNEREYIEKSLALRDRETKERESQQQRITIARTTAICFGIVSITLIVLLNRQSIINAFITANKKHLAESHLLKNFYLPKADLSGANLWKANLSKANLTETNLSKANLQSASLWKTYMPRANLSQADLSKANLSEANIDGSNLSRANLNKANLVKIYMRQAHLQDADLSQANLSGSDIDGSDFSRAKLNGASFIKTYMPKTQLQNADLSQANLSDAHIDDSDLSGANLQGAQNLNPEQVKRAKNWEKAKYDKEFRKKLGLK